MANRSRKSATTFAPLLRSKKRPAVSRGFTLFELLVTIAVIGILAAAIVPQLRSTDADRLLATAQIVASDFETARNLAVTNQSKYRLNFTPGTATYYLDHSGTNAVLNVLPASPFAASDDPNTKHTTDLGEFSSNSITVYGFVSGGTFSSTAFNIEFTSLGSTSATAAPTIWLTTGNGSDKRFLPITINPTTGIVDIGDFTARDPKPTSAGGTSSTVAAEGSAL